MSRALPAALGLAILCTAATGQQAVRRTVKVVLEQSRDRDWIAMDPRTVFNAGDTVRFRFQANFSGFLYVLNQTSRGDYLWMFPTSQAGMENRVEAGREYMIPATSSAFTVPPSSGFDTVYWIVTPLKLPDLPEFPAANPAKEPSPLLLPRCQSGPLRARGACLDGAAGARPLNQPERLPQALVSRDLASRPVTVETKDTANEVSDAASGPFIYEFRIAHR